MAQNPLFPTTGYKGALNNYVDYVRWQRGQLMNLLNRYRKELPNQIAAFKKSAYAAIPEASQNMWSGMYENLDKRGLSDSSAMLAGAQVDKRNWELDQKRNIEETAQGMKMSGQNAMLSALGKPNYADLYQQWSQMDKDVAQYLNYLKTNKLGWGEIPE